MNKNVNKLRLLLLASMAFSAIILISKNAVAQQLYNNGATLFINTGASLKVNGNAQFQSGSAITNNGTLTITGNVINNQTMGAANAGTLTFNGTATQTLSGTAAYFAKDVIVNNANGVTINTPLKIDGVFNFTNGIVTAATTANAVTFTTNATISGTNTAKDASHIKGFVIKEGNGAFTYPVGDGTKYQQVQVNLTANATGMRTTYLVADAGAATFTSTGTETTSLASYNNQEYWDITPLSTATGTVTIFWDGNKDTYSNAVNQRRVAHKTGGNWLNEGSAATGTIAAGSVISNVVNTWSPFALGSVIAVLPVKWLSVSGSISNQKEAMITWSVSEQNIKGYNVERSLNGTSFIKVGANASLGNGTNRYTFKDNLEITGTVYYRIKQTDANSQYSYSEIVKLVANNLIKISYYPNPVKDIATINGATSGAIAILSDLSGKVIMTINIKQPVFRIDMSKYAAGLYFLKMADGEVLKIIK